MKYVYHTAVVLWAVCVASAAAETGFHPDLPLVPFDASSAYTDDVRSLIVNPALIGVRKGLNIYYGYLMQDKGQDWKFDAARHFTLLAGFNELALGYQLRDLHGHEAQIFRFGYALPFSESFRLGMSLEWYHLDQLDDKDGFGLSTGFAFRPSRWLSLACKVENAVKPEFLNKGHRWEIKPEIAAGIAFRPFTNRVTLALDGYFRQKPYPPSGSDQFVLRVEIEPLEGFYLTGAYDGKENFNVGMRLNFTTGRSIGAFFRSEDEQEWDAVGGELSLTLRKQRSFLARRGFMTRLDVQGELQDYKRPLSLFGGSSANTRQLVQNLRLIENQKLVKGVLLRVGPLKSGSLVEIGGQINEIRSHIKQIRKAGKEVVVYLEQSAGITEYYLAAAADIVIMPASAVLRGPSLSLEIIRIRGLLEKLGIGWEEFAIGDYKSSFNQLSEKASEKQAEALQALVTNMYDKMLGDIAHDRNMSIEMLEKLSDEMLLLPQEAMDAGLIDGVGTYEDARTKLFAMAKRRMTFGEKHSFSEYGGLTNIKELQFIDYDWRSGPRIAVVGVYGPITMGESGADILFGQRSAGADTIVRQLRKARLSSDIKAVILRVDSPGGSAEASEAIMNEVLRYREDKKPIVVSMANLGASGGYLISCGANKIVANPLTLTGSIGVLAGKPVLKDLLEKLDMRREVYKKGEHGDAFSYYREFSEKEREAYRRVLQSIYDRFVQKVADNRDLSVEQVETLAEGRVYTGLQAKENHLVDVLGGLEQAIALAKEMAFIDPECEVELITYREKRGRLAEWLLRGLSPVMKGETEVKY